MHLLNIFSLKDNLSDKGHFLSDKGTFFLSDKGTFLSDKGTIFVGQGDIFCRTRGHYTKCRPWPQQAKGAFFGFQNASKT